VKAMLCVPLFLASYAFGDETADRLAIARTITALNESARSVSLFTHDADAAAELARLPKSQPPTPGPVGAPASPARTDHPTITISKEPWGEATINFPGLGPFPPVEFFSPRITSGAIRFITPDVALADGLWIGSGESGSIQTRPLLFVMKREEGAWKIAAIRATGPPRPR
jgi:hypothetical protein